VLGGIDLDPASSDAAQRKVRAATEPSAATWGGGPAGEDRSRVPPAAGAAGQSRTRSLKRLPDPAAASFASRDALRSHRVYGQVTEGAHIAGYTLERAYKVPRVDPDR
jgi:hypothetical protein